SNSSVLGKVYFPRLVMPLSTVFSELITFFIQFAMLLCFLAYYVLTNQGVHPNIYILMTPLLLIQMILLSLGCGIIISALTTKYRDLAMAVAFLVEIWKYLSPVAYDMYSLAALDIGGKYHSLYMLNPFTPIVNCFRYAYLGIGHMEWNYYIIGWLITIGIFLIGVVMFNKVERTFADTV
ncbi:MAG: ABC transporter permease, partial [Tannerellaceae bacterium]|nr:ABC transporter permease [Tannerellaceae bacterium]